MTTSFQYRSESDTSSTSNPPPKTAYDVSRRLTFLYMSMAFQDRQDANFRISNFEFTHDIGAQYVGRGASFTATKLVARVRFLDGKSEDKLLILKRPRFGNMDDNDPRWNSLILELRALTFAPLRAHPNIVKLLGIVWDFTTPVLVMECATYGTLASLERQNVQDRTRVRLCHDVARGLHFLHACFITHGDVKSENVLIFADSELGTIAKLCDFGASLLDMGATSTLRGGTQPWNAPEWKETMEKSLLLKTDIYSFGLLFWRVLIHKDPFSSGELFDLPSNPAARFEAIQTMKIRDEILPKAIGSIQGRGMVQTVESVFVHTLAKEPLSRDLESVLISFGQMEDAFKYVFFSLTPICL